MSELAKAAKVAFASTFSFYLKAHNYHWNVEGPNFEQYHQLFGRIYEEVFDSIDKFAEHIRAMNSYVPGSYTRFSMLTMVEDEIKIPNAEIMISRLLDDNEKMIKILKMTYKESEAASEFGFSNFIAERLEAHYKHGWQLRSTLKGST
jgi:starvation-inducible DNA-binding protein